MPTTLEKLESLFAKVRSLPKARQELAVDALSEIATDIYELSDDERAVLEPALREAEDGQNLTDLSVADILTKSWR